MRASLVSRGALWISIVLNFERPKVGMISEEDAGAFYTEKKLVRADRPTNGNDRAAVRPTSRFTEAKESKKRSFSKKKKKKKKSLDI